MMSQEGRSHECFHVNSCHNRKPANKLSHNGKMAEMETLQTQRGELSGVTLASIISCVIQLTLLLMESDLFALVGMLLLSHFLLSDCDIPGTDV